ncbi:MAG: STAS domain-containing protein [Planctomycetota bacterium]
MPHPTQPVVVRIIPQGDFHWVQIEGAICDAGSDTVRDDVSHAMEKSQSPFLIDLQRVDYVSSAGVGVLVGLLKKARQRGSTLTICGLNSDLQELFALTQLDRVFTIATDAEAYVRSIPAR